MLTSFMNIHFLYYVFVCYAVYICLHLLLIRILKLFSFDFNSVERLFNFGKCNDVKSRTSQNYLFSVIEIPKRWFLHYYIIATATILIIGGVIWDANINKPSIYQQWMIKALDFLATPQRKMTMDGISFLIAFGLLTLQIFRRLYETAFISVFSSGKMNILHYFAGITHYLGVILLFISEAPGFVNTGKVSNEEHTIPRGGMFELLSCPHMLAECLIYFGIWIILSHQHTTFYIICIWVCCNQVSVAMMNHKWYKDNFKDYPLRRKAIIPFVL